MSKSTSSRERCAYFSDAEHAIRSATSFGYAAGYDGAGPEKNPYTKKDERSAWESGRQRAAESVERK